MLVATEDTKIKNTVVCIGNFDGVHSGHIYLLNKAITIAKNNSLSSVALTFYPHPALYFGKKIDLLCSENQKKELIAKLGIDYYCPLSFDSKLSKMSPEEFFEKYLCSLLNARSIVVGFNFSFGTSRKGTLSLLEELCLKNGKDLYILEPIYFNKTLVSSTTIRNLILSGDMINASSMLGRTYFVEGVVVHGEALGRKLGYPTANLNLENKLLPPDGVYIGSTIINNRKYFGMVYIGTRPTVSDELIRKFEFNIFGFSENIYGIRLKVSIYERVRGCTKFMDLASLKDQLMNDERNIRMRLIDEYSKNSFL